MPFSDTMQSLCFGDGKFVAVGSGGVIHASNDGQLWNDGQRPVIFTLKRVIYANSQFMAVGDHGTIVTSSNGFAWTQQVSGTTDDLLAVTFGNGLYVASGKAGRLVISTNGSSWNTSSVGTSDLNWVTFGNGVFVLPSPNLAPTVLVSTDAQTWTPEMLFGSTIHPNLPHNLFQVEFGNGRFLAVVQDEQVGGVPLSVQPGGRIYVTTDGTNWIQETSLGSGPGYSVSHHFLSFVNGTFWEFANLGYMSALQINSSVNGSSFAQTLAPADAQDTKALAYGNGRYVIIENNGKCWTSIDATNWISGHGGFRSDVLQIITGQSNYVILASAQPIQVSSDGMTFTGISNSPVFHGDAGPTYGIFNAIVFDGTNYVAVGGARSVLGLLPPPGTTAFIYTSTNSTDWISRSANANQILTAICRGSSRWVAVGQTGTVISSPNTLAWTLRPSGTANTLNSVAFGNGIYVAVGNGGTIISSPDGASWDVQYSGTTSDLNCVRYIGGQFYAVGQGGIILTSIDGGTWTGVTSGTAASLGSIAYGNKSFVICGSGAVLTSTDGLIWQNISTKLPSALNASSVAFLNQSFWIVGDNGSILQSDSIDGIPQFNGTMKSDSGCFRLKISLNIPPQYRIQFSTNFSTWLDLASFTNSSSPAIWDDTNVLKSPVGFYRIATP